MTFSPAQSAAHSAYLGEILVRQAGLSRDALARAMAKQREEGGELGEILVRMNAIDEGQLTRALSVQYEVPYAAVLPAAEDIDAALIENLPIGFAKQHKVLPIGRDPHSGRVQVAMADPLAIDVLDDIGVLVGGAVDGVLAAPTPIVELINKVFGRLRQSADLDHEKKEEEEDFHAEELVDILDVADEAPIIAWVNSLLFLAVKERASDIHIEPGEKDVKVRFRIDGVLREVKNAPRKFLASILARVKIMAGLNIAEKRLPQDGRIRRKIGGKDIDMRVATAPTAGGERVTIRLLDRSSVLLGLPDIGMAADTLKLIRGVIARPHGILLVTGPTGSGKTTTLYACLSEINSPDLNILTVEDPVEYQLEGISQTQVNPKIDLTFATGLRSFLRHDPDVIMVGEIRDPETAEVAITASLTGHLVLSTVHTNDAAGGVTRLVDMGIEPFLVASSLVGLMAQRLVRRPCSDCAEPVRPTEEVVRELGLDPQRFYAGRYELPEVKGSRPMPMGTVLRPVGCGLCLDTGYTGRTGIYEMLMVDEAVRALTLQKADAQAIKKAATDRGMVTLRMEGARKVMQGMTTPEEVLMVTSESEISVPLYAYKGIGSNGKPSNGVRDAESPKALRQLLRKDGVVVTQVDLSRGGKKVARGKGLSKEVDFGDVLGKVRKTDVAAFTRQLATLLKAGIPLAECLGALFEQADKVKLKRVLGEVRGAVNEGSSLGDALGKHPSVFDELYTSMVKAGETAGNLDEVLLRLADFMESSQKLRSKVKSAMVYPTIMVCVGIIILSILMIVVVPNITKMFTQQGRTLPLKTRVLVWVSHTAGAFWFVWLGLMVSGAFGFRTWVKGEGGRTTWHKFVLKLPMVGALVRQVAVARFARTLGTMLHAGVPMLRALEIARAVLGNVVLAKAVDEARAGVTEGESLAVMLRKSGHFPATVTHMIAVGERSGSLEAMLLRIADSYEQEIDMRLGRLTSMLEPLMILVMGVTVAFVVFAILEPLMDMSKLR